MVARLHIRTEVDILFIAKTTTHIEFKEYFLKSISYLQVKSIHYSIIELKCYTKLNVSFIG